MPQIGAVLANTQVAITTSMLEPVIDTVVDNIAVVLPIGVVLFGIMLGISMVPKILKRMAK